MPLYDTGLDPGTSLNNLRPRCPVELLQEVGSKSKNSNILTGNYSNLLFPQNSISLSMYAVPSLIPTFSADYTGYRNSRLSSLLTSYIGLWKCPEHH